MNCNQRVLAVLQGCKPDRIPFLGRMDFWYGGLTYQRKMPPRFSGCSLPDIHKSIGYGLEDWMSPYAFKYRNLELITYFDDQKICHEYEPEISFFPDLWGKIPFDCVGEALTELITPIGKLVCKHRVIKEGLISGITRSQLYKNPVSVPQDFQIYEYILEHSEFVPKFEQFYTRAEEIGEAGFLIPTLNRVPFQSILIDVMGEIACFYAIYDTPSLIDRLLKVIDQQTVELLEKLAGFNYPYVEFIDNLDGFMTNPRLFEKYVLPSYQKYCDILHSQNKLLGSHLDGNLNNLVRLLADCGLDVCESFTPAPLTDCTFEAAYESWGTAPMIWGGIPSYYLERRVSEGDLHEYIDSLLSVIAGRPVILGIADAVMPDNMIERVQWIAEYIESAPV